jgi:hypothetical protein
MTSIAKPMTVAETAITVVLRFSGRHRCVSSSFTHLSVRNDPACVEPAKPGPAEVDGCPSVLIHRALVGVVVEAPLIIEASAENPEGGTKGPVVEAAGVKVFAGETDVDGMLEAGDTEEAPADDGRAVDEAAADAADEAGGTMRAEDATVEETGAAGAGPDDTGGEGGAVEGGGALDCGAPGLALRLKISVFFISTLCLHYTIEGDVVNIQPTGVALLRGVPRPLIGDPECMIALGQTCRGKQHLLEHITSCFAGEILRRPRVE